MKNKKGFTLVELLAVIVIISIIAIIAIPSITKTSNDVKAKMLVNKIELAEKSLILWGQDNRKCFTGGGTNCMIMTCYASTLKCTATFGDMASFGLINYDEGTKVINPVDKSSLNNSSIVISYNSTNKSFSYEGAWITENGKWYYYDSSMNKLTNKTNISLYWGSTYNKYSFNASGECTSGC